MSMHKGSGMMRGCLILGIAIAVAWAGCEKNISLSVPKAGQELVVEGTIENGKPPRVVLSHSLGYFSEIDTTILKGLFVHGARITVTGNGRTVALTEHVTDTLNGNKYYYYAPDSTDAPWVTGKRGGTYTLHIEVEGRSYDAQTTIPSDGFKLDSVWWVWGVKDSKPDTTEAFLMARIVDPPEAGNYARYFTRRNNGPFYPGLTSVADDEITNGTTFDFQIDAGMNKNLDHDFSDGYFNPGDTVTLKFCNIDKATYDFWHTWEYAWSNAGNPFSTPTAVLGNVPGALGYWGGYEARYVTIIIPK